MNYSRLTITMFASFVLTLFGHAASAQPAKSVDLLTLPDTAGLFRGLGSVGVGHSGVPVAAGHDLDGDGFVDSAFAAMRASPLNRVEAGLVHLLFGDGTIGGTLDTAVAQPRLLQIYGDLSREHLGSEIWMDDVTGDGVGDLLICRQDFGVSGRVGTGALTIVVGSPALRTLAATSGVLDLRSPPASVEVFTLHGRAAGDRLGIWVRTGDIDGDTVADLVVGADQERVGGQTHAGAVYLIRGGTHLATTAFLDLANLGGGSPLEDQLIRVVAPDTLHDHFGATVALGDLDGDGRSEVFASKALNRAGAVLQPQGGSGNHGSGGTQFGTLFILWGQAIPASPQPWPSDITLVPGTQNVTALDGGPTNSKFGEELLGGLDYDGDGDGDLFVGDITGNSPNGGGSGLGYVFFDAQALRGLDTSLPNLPASIRFSTLYGPRPSAISSDTAAHGDVNADGYADLMVGSPHDAPFNRLNAGTIHVLLGQGGGWPEVIDLAPGALPPNHVMEIVELYGGNGIGSGDAGDTLCYSAATGDFDGDGHLDLVANEMLGNGGPMAIDTGNLILLSGQVLSNSLFADGFEIGGYEAWASVKP